MKTINTKKAKMHLLYYTDSTFLFRFVTYCGQRHRLNSDNIVHSSDIDRVTCKSCLRLLESKKSK
jgi:hypothetical protein